MLTKLSGFFLFFLKSGFPFAVLLSHNGGRRSNGRKTDASSTKHDGEQQQRAETDELSGGEDGCPIAPKTCFFKKWKSREFLIFVSIQK